jgi:hypothetical protein
MLNPIVLDEAALRARFEQTDDYDGFSEFDPINSGEFDSMLVAIMTAVNEALPVTNADRAGTRQHPWSNSLDPVLPTESIDVCLIADLDGTVAGYMWTYDLYGARRLSLATGFTEWKNMQPEGEGIDACVEIAKIVIGHVNRAIADFTEFVGGAK